MEQELFCALVMARASGYAYNDVNQPWIWILKWGSDILDMF